MSTKQNSTSRLKRQGFEKARGLSSLRRCRGTREEEDHKEQIANEMLRQAEHHPAHPAQAEPQLARRVAGRCVVRLDSITEHFVSQRPSQSSLDELKLLIALTPLNQRERFFLRGWMLGWSHSETAARWMDHFDSDGRFTVCRVLKQAMEKCQDNAELSFDAISRHAIYRRPSHRRETWGTTICRHCKEPYLRGFGDGPYCSTGCRSAVDHP